MRYVPYHELGELPNVIVDGPPNAHTVLALSHWPGTGSPPELARDTSAEMVFAWLEVADRYPTAEVVSNNHFDVDGLVALYAATEPDEARARRRRLEQVASAGDFSTWHDRAAARVAMALEALADPARSPLDPDTFAGPIPGRTAKLYRATLERLPGLCDHPEQARELWGPGDALLQAGLDGLATGMVEIDERPEWDLAVVRVDEAWASQVAATHGTSLLGSVDPMALYRHVQAFRVLVAVGPRVELRDRYETWVQVVSRRPQARVDWRPLARRLDSLETGEVEWEAGNPRDISPALRPANPERASDLGLDDVVAEVEDYLRTAEVAWDPFSL